MPVTFRNNSPGARFLDHGDQLMTLQGRVVKQMMSDTETEQGEIQNRVISAETDPKKFVRDTMTRIAKSQARFADLDLLFQLLFCRHVDNFQIFLEELLADAVHTQPKLVDMIPLGKSGKNLPVAEKLDRRLRKLSFMSLGELAETVKSGMGFELFSTSTTQHRTAFLYDVRNLITHRYGIIDAHFLKKYPRNGFEVGAMFPLANAFIGDAFTDLTKGCADIQQRAVKHFALVYETTTVGQVEWWEESGTPALPMKPQQK